MVALFALLLVPGGQTFGINWHTIARILRSRESDFFSVTQSQFLQIVRSQAFSAVLTLRMVSDKFTIYKRQIHICLGRDLIGRSRTHYRRYEALPPNCWSNVKMIMTQDRRLSRPWRRWFIILLISIWNLITLCNFPATQCQCGCSLLPQANMICTCLRW